MTGLADLTEQIPVSKAASDDPDEPARPLE